MHGDPVGALSPERQEAVRDLLTMAVRLLEESEQPMARVPLSSGEIELLAHLQSRETGVQIAARLGISVNTLKTRLKRLYRKLGVTSRDDAIALASRRGLVS